MTTYSSPGVLTKSGSQVHGEVRSTNRIHENIALPATLSGGDLVQIGYLPTNAVVAGMTLKAGSQLDTNPTPTLAFDVGTMTAPQLFTAMSIVGRAAGSSADITLLPTGLLYKNTTGIKQLIVAAVHTAAATPAAGSLEVQVSYFVEEASGSPA